MPISSGALGKPNSYFNLPEKDRFKGNRVIPEDELKRRQNESGKRKISATDNSGGKGRKATTSTGIGGAAAGGAGSGKGGAGKDRKKKSKKSNTSKTKVTVSKTLMLGMHVPFSDNCTESIGVYT